MSVTSTVGKVLSTIFSDLSDEVTETLAVQALGDGYGPGIVHIKGNDQKIRGEAPYIPAQYAEDIAAINTPKAPVYKDYHDAIDVDSPAIHI